MSAPVAVTGASGFVGQALIAQLLAAGQQVRALVHHRPLPIEHPALETVSGALGDDAALARLIAGAGAVVHVAGRVRGRNAADFLPVNADGAARVARLAGTAGGHARLILISSLAARAPHLSDYAASKRAGEERLAEAASDSALSWAALRPPAVYGPGDRELRPLFSLISRGITPLPAAPGARLSLLHVSDLAAAIIALIDSPAQGIFELHDGHEGGYDWEEVATIVESVTGRGRGWRVPVPQTLLRSAASANLAAARIIGYLPMLTPGKVNELRHPDWVCDNTELGRATGWQPAVSLHEGLGLLLGGARHGTNKGTSNVT